MSMRVIVTAVAIAAATPAMAANLVTNGGFETSDFTGWTQFDNTGFSGVTTGIATEGTYAAFFGPVGSTGGITQTLGNAAGSYIVSFDLHTDGGTTNSFSVTFGGNTLLSFVDGPAVGYASYSFTTSGLGNDQLAFAFRHDPAFFYLDNVSVTAAVPEPATWALMIGGFGMTGFAMRRRRFALNA